MPCHSLICQGSSKEACTFWASSWWSSTSEISASSGHQSGISCTHACQVTHVSYPSIRGSWEDLFLSSSSKLPASSWRKWSTSGSNSGSGSRWNPGEALWPLHPPQILDPTGEDYTQRRGQGSPLAKPCSTSCFVPRIFSFSGHGSESGHGHLASLRWQTSSASLFSLPRWPQLLGLSKVLPLPWQGLSQQRCPSSSSWWFWSLEAGHLPDQASPNPIVVCPLSAPGGLLGRTLPQSVSPFTSAPRVGTLVASWVYTLESTSLWILPC